MFKRYQQIHFVGIGGSGMSGIAEIVLNLGYRVTGSDMRRNDAVERLEQLGAKVFIGHDASNVDDSHVVVYSSAVSRDNVEVRVARERQIPVIPRAEMLAELMRLKYGVAVAGAHGKTSTTAMIAEALTEGGLDPTVVSGGRRKALRSGAKVGRGDFMVAEADESDGSFLKMKPTIAVVTNIDREHLDHYRDLAEIQDTFVNFLARVPFYGAAAPTADVPKIRAALLIHFAEDDKNINDRWPEYEAALKSASVKFEAYFYPETLHGFHNNSTPRYQEKAAKLAWDRTVAHFKKHLA